ncbi:PQQ-binding-like beta-propeller repeat protein [Halorussus sp. MSC15.2]|uniref:outer membrane protein assembly factor BamB family protein n=1 Tax=Halorussus sp. MSC15.2 TaxID=2283638 RepID=UPI0013D7E157|nr:PQQ-binding-like beta-propeller repeat protein [Halorussus sp. MSC15.2]NEU55941.1 PQQ-binding-like beta-propeller repeat protein [Halorussus sp. MSC15.2]
MAAAGAAFSIPKFGSIPVEATRETMVTNALSTNASRTANCTPRLESKNSEATVSNGRFGPSQSGYAPSIEGPSGENVGRKWTLDANSSKLSSPVVGNGVAFSVAYHPQAELVAVNLQTGNELWTTKPKSNGQSVVANAPPTVRGANVIAGFSNGSLHANETQTQSNGQTVTELSGRVTALRTAGEATIAGTSGKTTSIVVMNRAGTVCQEYRLKNPITKVTGLAVADGKVFYSAAGQTEGHPTFGSVGAIDVETGDVLWDVMTKGQARGVSVAGKSAFVRTTDYTLTLNAQTGEHRWHVDTHGGSWVPPTVADGTVYFGGHYEVAAIDAATGSVEWRHEMQAINPRPIVAGDAVFVAADAIAGRPGIVTSLSPSTGETKWTEEIPKRNLSTPMVTDGTLLVSAYRAAQGAPGTEQYQPSTGELIALEGRK